MRGRWIVLRVMVVLACGAALTLGAVGFGVERLPWTAVERGSWIAGVALAAATAVAWVLRSGGSSAPGWVTKAPRVSVRVLARTSPAMDVSIPFIRRESRFRVSEELRAADERFHYGVVVTGRSKAGKSRLLAEVLANQMGERFALQPPEDADLRLLAEWLTKQPRWRRRRGWVLWLDDLDRRLPHAGLDPATLHELRERNVIVAATMRIDPFNALRPPAAEAERDQLGYPVLDALTPVPLSRGWTSDERRSAADSGDPRLVDASTDPERCVAVRLASGPELQHRFDDGADGHVLGYHTVKLLIHLDGTGLSSPQSRHDIQRLARKTLPPPPPLAETDDEAWAWATTPTVGTHGLLIPTDHDGERWRAFDYLTTDEPIPDDVWDAAIELADPSELNQIAWTAFSARLLGHAESAVRKSIKDDERPKPMLLLGVILREQANAHEKDKVSEAERWLRKAAECLHPGSMTAFGNFLYESGRTQQAEYWWQRAIHAGVPQAMTAWAISRIDLGQLHQSKLWLNKAVEAGDTFAIRPRSNTSPLPCTDESGHYIRSLLGKRVLGHSADAIARRLIALGMPLEAEVLLRTALAINSAGTHTRTYLGFALRIRGNIDESACWFRDAAYSGEPVAMHLCGKFLYITHQREGEYWIREAAEKHALPDAMVTLGAVLIESARMDEGAEWLREAARNHHPHALPLLGRLVYGIG
ncbi:sel1 repeat family protein [Spiractinospora alimapuensis]|uniref:hypothetical protein n=1 Tax=Spiractinospora alimapuensis TaxID=2820884 RepID=UPI001F1F45D9|nr:hypothetical protein [Spiractinospora alimapuensis]QVQ53389.1 sel1 repeat family protein [Spiractinospora alimapuensis]